jgi:hypothetical protein
MGRTCHPYVSPTWLSRLTFPDISKSIFRTSHDPAKGYINETSSYADLAPLYGNNETTQRDLRVNDVARTSPARFLR